MGYAMATVRLPSDMDEILKKDASATNRTKSDIIREALEVYYYPQTEANSLEIAEPYIGKYGSGDGSLSTTYKTRLKEKLHAAADERKNREGSPHDKHSH
jgi:predicted DNA-binding protein